MTTDKAQAVLKIGGAVIALSLFYLLLLPFLLHSVQMVSIGFDGDPAGQSYLFSSDGRVGNVSMIAHIGAGIVLTTLVPLQLVGPLRRRWTAFHRATGILLVSLAVVTALAGMLYIMLRGTIGGAMMSAGFFLYGLCLLTAAVNVARNALLGDRLGHWKWALRLFWLALGSWLYRLHYVIWYLLTDGAWSEPDFSGAFDKVQNFAFYIPYLIAVQVWIILRQGKQDDPARVAI